MSTEPSNYPRPAYAWYMVALLLVVYTFSFIDRQILGLLGPAIKADFGITDAQFGLLTGLAFALFYASFGLVCARIADSSNRKWLITGGLFLWSLMTAASGMAQTYWHLFLLRMGVGVGEATLGPAANSMLADSFPKEKLSTALSVYSMGIPVGTGLAFIVGGAVIGLVDDLPNVVVPGVGELSAWQKTFLIVGLPGLLLTLIVATLKEPIRHGTTAGQKAVPVREVAAYMKARWKAYFGLIAGVSVNAAIGFGTNIWLTFFFTRNHGLSPQEIGITFGSIAVVTGALGLYVVGRIADHLMAKGQRDAHVKALMIAPIGFFIPTLIFPLADSVTVAWIFVALASLFLQSPSGVAFACFQVMTPNRMRGQVTSVYILSTNIIGYAGGSYFIGYLSDVFGQEDAGKGLAYAFVIVAAMAAPLCIVLYLFARKTFMEAMEKEYQSLNKT